MDDNSLMPFGKFKGEKLANVPADYLLWYYEQEWCKGELKNYIKDNLESLNTEVNLNKK